MSESDIINRTAWTSHIQKEVKRCCEEQMAYVDAHLKLEDVAREIGVCSRHLSFYFNDVIGKNFNTYINDLRIEYACFLMESEPDSSLEEIAYGCGFNIPGNFSRAFRARKGETPRDYRCKLSIARTVIDYNFCRSDTMRVERYKALLYGPGGRDAFMEAFQKDNPNFVDKAQEIYPNIKGKDEFLAQLLLSGVDNVTMADALGVNRASLRVAKCRLLRKMGILGAPGDSLINLLKSRLR